jgi:NAD+ diphosphatase
MTFIPDHRPIATEVTDALWFVFQGGQILIKSAGDGIRLPETADLNHFDSNLVRKLNLGRLDERPCYAAELADSQTLSDGFRFVDLRELFFTLTDELIWVAGRANQLVIWNQNHRFCGKCGRPTAEKTDERAKMCPQCGMVNYPRISPAVIVAVTKSDQLLLAHSGRFPTKFYSVLAGFVETGESLEECVRREIMEEVGIEVRNIRYFGSQPWPFPDSLMIGFTAEHAAGRIKIDGAEIADADWFSADNLPRIPPRLSIARKLIDWFVENNTKPSQN